MNAKQLFEQALARLADANNWSNGAAARDGCNNPVDPLDTSAVRFSGDGLLVHLQGEWKLSWLLRKLDAVAKAMGWLTFMRVNDIGGLEAVRECFRLAMAQEEPGAKPLGGPPNGIYRAEIEAALQSGDESEAAANAAINAGSAADHFHLREAVLV